jgi:hypothetical protein
MNVCIFILIKRTLSNSTYEYIVTIGGAFALYYFGKIVCHSVVDPDEDPRKILGLPDPDPSLFDPDPSIIKQKKYENP